MKPMSLFAFIVIGILLFCVGVLVLYSAKMGGPKGMWPVAGGEGQMCTADAKQCPDGSYVSRTGPNCSFAECPGTAAGASVELDI